MLWKILRHDLCVIKAAHRSWCFTFTQILRIHSRYRYYFYRMLHHLLVISSRGIHSKNSRFDPQTKIYINNTGIIHLYTRGVFKLYLPHDTLHPDLAPVIYIKHHAWHILDIVVYFDFMKSKWIQLITWMRTYTLKILQYAKKQNLSLPSPWPLIHITFIWNPWHLILG